MDKEIKNKKFLITGATGLIGQSIVRRILMHGGKVVAVVRDLERAKKIIGEDSSIEFILSDINTLPIEAIDVDYIIHAAANTSSKAFIEEPLSIIDTSINGTKRVLEISRLSNVKGMVYLSSMEVYGTPQTDDKIDELHGSNLNTMSVRSCYPESKRLCECLCAVYASHYKVPAKVIRLTQTFGPGVRYSDGRVFAQFARCVIEGKDIVLKTKGETKRNYLYTEEAVDAILTVLIYGKAGEAYNAANEDSYCSIYDMAMMVASKSEGKKIKVLISDADTKNTGYAPTLHMNLDTGKLKKLGWQAHVGLSEMFDQLIDSMRKEI